MGLILDLLLSAHRLEASCFIDAASQVTKRTYSGQIELIECSGDLPYYVCVAGEGMHSVTVALSSLLSQPELPISRVWNIGASGILQNHLAIGQVVSIRTCYSQLDGNKLRYHSYTSSDSNAEIDCITANDRVLDVNVRDQLSCFASCVDREAWAVSSVANQFRLPFIVKKYLTDFANCSSVCEDVRQMGEELSHALYLDYIRTANTKAPESERENERLELSPDYFYCTSSQSDRLQKLWRQLGQHESLGEIFSAVKTIERLQVKPKVRTQLLIEKMEGMLFPERIVAKNAIERILRDTPTTSSRSIRARLFPDIDGIEVKAQLTSKKELEELCEELRKLPMKELEQIWNGLYV